MNTAKDGEIIRRTRADPTRGSRRRKPPAERAQEIGLAWARRRPGVCTVLGVDAEDIAQDAALEYLESGKIGERGVIDSLRRRYGRTERVARIGAITTTCDEVPESTVRTDEYELVDQALTLEVEWWRLHGRDQRLAEMLLLQAEGMTLAEIGRQFGVSESYVSKLLTAHRERAA